MTALRRALRAFATVFAALGLVLLLAPGPINRGVEVTPEVADGPNSAILDQVTNGVAVRMAILFLLIGTDSPKSL